MAKLIIEENFPKTAAYINETFDKEGRERGGHHNYVVEQKICNFSQEFGLTVADCEEKGRRDILEKADNDFLSCLKYADGEVE